MRTVFFCRSGSSLFRLSSTSDGARIPTIRSFVIRVAVFRKPPGLVNIAGDTGEKFPMSDVRERARVTT